MPIDIKIVGASWDTTVTVFNNTPNQTFSFDVTHTATAIQLDPQNWILKGVNYVALATSTDSLGFGYVPLTQHKTDTATISNTGTLALNISSVTTDNVDFTVSPSVDSIPVGGIKDFYITFSPSDFNVKTCHVNFNHDGSTSPTQICVTGSGQSIATLFSASTDTVDFDTVLVHGNKLDSVTVTNTGIDPLVISSATSDSAEFTVVPSSATIQSLQTKVFYVKYVPSHFGTNSGKIIFIHNGISSPGYVAVLGFGGYWNSAITVCRNWNLVSVPYTANNYQKDTVFPGALTQAFAYVPGSGYAAKETLRNGAGYWLKYSSYRSITIIGLPISSDTFDVVEGWNLIGSIASPGSATSIISDPPGMITSDFYGYGTGYKPADTIQPGKGYWVKVNQDGKLILFSSPFFAVSATRSKSFRRRNFRLIRPESRQDREKRCR